MPNQFPSFNGIPSGLSVFLMILFMSALQLPAQGIEEPAPEKELERLDDLLFESIEERGDAVEDVSGRHEWFQFQRRFPYSTMPAGIRAQAVRENLEFKQILSQSRQQNKGAEVLADESKWENIGPFNVAGRVRAILVHPVNKGTVYIGAATGGVWKTTGVFSEWTTTFDNQSALSIGSMAFDPTNPDVIYVGTGEVINSRTSQFNSTPSYFGDGVFKSTDGGETWFHSGLSQLGTISDVYVRSDNPDIVYVTSAQGGGGFYRSTDGGRNWEQRRSGVFFEMAVNPQNEDEILMAASGSILRSTDMGNNWELTDGYTPNNSQRSSIALAPSNPNRVYALAAANSSGNGEVYISNDGGRNWTLSRRFGSSFFNGQGHYNNCVAVHPTDPDIALVGGIDIYRTSTGGSSWSNTTNSYRGGNVHPDQHSIAFDPLDNNVVYLGNDGGVYRSSNTGRTWQRVSLSLPITQYYEIGLDQTRPYRVYGGTQDNGSHGALGGSSWPEVWNTMSVFGGDGFHVIVDESDPNYIFAESQYGRLFRVRVSAPQNFAYLTSQLDQTGSSSYDPGAWSTPIAMSPVDKISLYTGRRALWRTFDFGNEWIAMRPGNQSRISAIGLSPFDANKLAIGTAGGELYFSTDGGEDWTRSTGIPGRYVSEVLYDPVDPNRIYVTVSGTRAGHVFRSDDNGANFTDITSTLPDLPTSSIAVDPDNNNVLFVANDIGVFVSLDGGEVWLPFNDNLPYAPVVDLEIHKSRRTLVAGTHGRSIFEVSIDNPQPQPVLLEPIGGAPYASEDTLNILWAGFGDRVRVLISFDGGRTFDTLAVDVAGTSLDYVLPFIRSTNTIVRVETVNGEVIVDSSPFSISPRPNTSGTGGRGFVAGAIEAVGRNLWTVDRETNEIVSLRLPTLLPTGSRYTPEGIAGDILDLAYDEDLETFFILSGNFDDLSASKLHVMDSDGNVTSELPLPEANISGIAVTPDGLIAIASGPNGNSYILDTQTGEVIAQGAALQNASGIRRVGLAWDGAHLAQGVDEAQPGTSLPDAVQRLVIAEDIMVHSEIPLVIEANAALDFYGIAFYPDGDAATEGKYYITGTDGQFYVLEAPVVSSVGIDLVHTARSTIAISNVSPNPFRDKAALEIRMASAGDVTLEVYDADGRRIATPFSGRLEAGDHTLEFDGGAAPSGIYHMVLTGPNGDRDIKPAVLLR